MKQLKIAIFVAKFDPTFKNPWLTDELCQAIDGHGHAVDVFFLDWYREFTAGSVITKGNTTVHIIAPVVGKSGVISKMLHWALSSFNVSKYYRARFRPDDHDLLICFSPSVMFGIALLTLKSWFKHRFLIQWDFFPYHQEQLGLIPFRWITRVGAILESKFLSTFTFIGCMSPRNVAYLKQHYNIASKVQTGIVPLWAKIRDQPVIDKVEVRKQFGLPLNVPIAVFGGQIAAGRGIEDVVQAAELAAKILAPVHFLFVGKGPKLEWLLERANSNKRNLTVLPHVPRDKYLELISCCDAGIVATVRDVDVPTYPSKTLDYCCVGLPIIASVERSTDYGEIVSAAGIGLCCEAGDGDDLLQLSLKLFEDEQARRVMSENSRIFYTKNFNVQKIASELLSMVKNA